MSRPPSGNTREDGTGSGTGAASVVRAARTPVPGHPVSGGVSQLRATALRWRSSVSTVSISGEW